MAGWYVYVIHESPIQKPYYVKVGISADPLRRLAELQAGNPRRLRSADRERMPTTPFGIRVESEEIAREVEEAVHQQLQRMGARLISDLNYESETAFEREWFEGVHPDQVWILVAKAICD